MSTIDQTLTFLSGHAQSALADANDVTNRMAFLTDLPTRSAGFSFTANKPNVSKPESFGDIAATIAELLLGEREAGSFASAVVR